MEVPSTRGRVTKYILTFLACLVLILPYLLTTICVYILMNSFMNKIEAERPTPVCTSCDSDLYKIMWYTGDGKCRSRRYSCRNKAKKRDSNSHESPLFVLVEYSPPNECHVVTSVARTGKNSTTLFLASKDGVEVCARIGLSFRWEIVVEDENQISKIFTSFPTSHVNVSTKNTAKIPISMVPIKFNDTVPPLTRKGAEEITQQIKDSTGVDFFGFDYCNGCEMLNVTLSTLLCPAQIQFWEGVQYSLGFFFGVTINLGWCFLIYIPFICISVWCSCWRDIFGVSSSTRAERSPLLKGIQTGKKKEKAGIVLPKENLKEEMFEQEDREDATRCVVCFKKLKTCAVIDCGHVCLCSACGRDLGGGKNPKCPICKMKIKEGIRKIFF